MIVILGICLLWVYISMMILLSIGVYRAHKKSSQSPVVVTQPITIIVIARNEEETLGRCLTALERQQYGQRLQVIIVDDDSSDKTKQIADEYAARNNHWQVLGQPKTPRWRNRKKSAIATAYEQADGHLLFFTDADCRPPVTWIRSMASLFDEHTYLVVGFSPLYCIGKPLWRRFLLVTSLADALIAAGTIGWGIGVTCSGRNLAYRKSLVAAIGGYAALADATAGDDDAILQAASRLNRGHIKYSFSKDAQIPALGPSTWRKFWQQKKRHLSAGKYYPWHHQVGYLFLHFSNYSLWFTGVLAIFGRPYFLFFLVTKIVMDWLSISYMAHKLQQRLHPTAFLLWQLVFPLYHIFCAPAAWLERFSWKDRDDA